MSKAAVLNMDRPQCGKNEGIIRYGVDKWQTADLNPILVDRTIYQWIPVRAEVLKEVMSSFVVNAVDP